MSIRRDGRHVSVLAKIRCTARALLDWVKKAEVDRGKYGREAEGLGAREPRTSTGERISSQANEILRKASAYFAQAELGRRVKP
jgi:transposase